MQTFNIVCYHREFYLKDLNLEGKELIFEKGKNANFLQARNYASLSGRYCKNTMEFYCEETHPDMVLHIIMERSTLCLTLSTLYE